MNDAIDLAEIIDAIVLAALKDNFPIVPSVVAKSISDVLFRDAGRHYAEYHAQVLRAVNERTRYFSETSLN